MDIFIGFDDASAEQYSSGSFPEKKFTKRLEGRVIPTKEIKEKPISSEQVKIAAEWFDKVQRQYNKNKGPFYWLGNNLNKLKKKYFN